MSAAARTSTPDPGCEYGRDTRQHVDEVLDPAVEDYGRRLRSLERSVWRMGAVLALLACLGSIVGGAIASRLFGETPAAQAAPAPAAVRVVDLDAGGSHVR
jgi:hypothetical protein